MAKRTDHRGIVQGVMDRRGLENLLAMIPQDYLISVNSHGFVGVFTPELEEAGFIDLDSETVEWQVPSEDQRARTAAG